MYHDGNDCVGLKVGLFVGSGDGLFVGLPVDDSGRVTLGVGRGVGVGCIVGSEVCFAGV